jgi:hypothetical protein
MFKAIVDGKNVIAVIHRRAGKDIFCMQSWLLRGLQRVGTHVYLFPLYSQARSVIWRGMDYDGRPFMSAIPDALVAKKNEARMEIELFNGSRLVLAGSNNYDSLMGTNPVTLIYSEFSLHNPLARQYLNPIIIQNNGIEIIQATPRGMNHLHEVFNIVRDNPSYHVEHLSVEQTFKHDGVTPIISQADIQRAKDLGMSEEMIRQEFYVDFEVGNMGSYFTREISDMEREGRITTLKPNPHLPLHTVWDLGGTDATAGWIFQIEGRFIHLLHLLHDTGKGLKHYLDEAERYRQSVQCNWGNHFMPHDVKQKHQGWENTESRIMQARKHGWLLQVTPTVAFEDGIEAMRYVLPRIRIDKLNCTLGLRAIREYQRTWDEGLGRYSKLPLDNWAVHIVDALRYLCTNYKRLYDVPQAPTSYATSQ